MKVMKFGGTSVGSAEAILSLLQIVKEESEKGEQLIVVCSAMNGVTGNLLDLLDHSSTGNSFSATLKSIEDRHYETVRQLLEVKRQNQALLSLKLLFNELEELLAGVKALGEVSNRIRDKVLSYGELLSCTMITSFIDQHCGKAVLGDTRHLIKTDSRYGRATVLEEPTNILIQDFIIAHPDTICVLTGFISSDEKGETTTLGRGGSDYTAAIAGAAIKASEIQIWTDVNGIMTADPRIVKKAFSIKRLSYVEAIELSYFGAKVIHSPTMIPAQAANIPIVIKNTFNIDFEGTTIGPNTTANGSLIKGISFIPEISLITVTGSGMVGLRGFSGRLFNALAHAGVNIILITQASSEHSITLAVSPADSQLAGQSICDEFEQELALKKIVPPMIENNYSIIAIVGENMRHTRGLSGKFFSALGRSGVNVVAIAQGSSELNISTVIDRQDLAKAMNSVHDSMFLSPVKTLHVFCCGLGNIGSTLLKQIESHRVFLEEKRHVKINLAGICNSKRFLTNADGISLSQWKEDLAEKGVGGNVKDFIKEATAMNLSNSVFIDNTGSPAVAGLYPWIFGESISVVACNKIGVSGSYHQYRCSKDKASQFGVDYWYETSVGAGLPIIKTIHDLLISGDHIIKIEAILSGTISYIFNNYRGDKTFEEVVRDAREKGFTEPDPRDDLSGLDFARKMLILARETGAELEIKDIALQQLLPDNCLQATSIDDFFLELKKSEDHFRPYKLEAEQQKKALHYVGTLTDDGKAAIELKMLEQSHPFFNLSGSDNIISLTTHRYLNNPMVIKGPGAGAEVTAAGVLADLVRVASV
jgi:bifunctional aspartokinase / homoserine dehydrogenase 1